MKMSDEVDVENVDETKPKESHTIRHICNYLIDFKEMKSNIIINYIRSKVESEVEALSNNLSDNRTEKLRIYKSLYTIAIVVNIIKKKIIDIDLKDTFKSNSISQLVDLTYNINKEDIYTLNMTKDFIENELKKIIIIASKHTYQTNIDVQDEYNKVSDYIKYYLFDYIYSLFKYFTTDAKHYNADRFGILRHIFDINKASSKHNDKALLDAVSGHLLDNKQVIKILKRVTSPDMLNDLYIVLNNELSLSHNKNKELLDILNNIKPKYPKLGFLRRRYIQLLDSTNQVYFDAKPLPLYMTYCLTSGSGGVISHNFSITLYKNDKNKIVEVDNFRNVPLTELSTYKFVNSKCNRCGYVREFIDDTVKNTYLVNDNTILDAIKLDVAVSNNIEKLQVYCPLGSIHKLVNGVCEKCGYEKDKKYAVTDKYYKNYIVDEALFRREFETTIDAEKSQTALYMVDQTQSHGYTKIELNKLTELAVSLRSTTKSFFYDRLKIDDIVAIFPLMGMLRKHKYEDVLKYNVVRNDELNDVQLARIYEYISFLVVMMSYIYNRDTKPYSIDISSGDIEYNYNYMINSTMRGRLYNDPIDDCGVLINELIDFIIGLHDMNLKKYICEKILYNEFINSKALEKYQLSNTDIDSIKI